MSKKLSKTDRSHILQLYQDYCELKADIRALELRIFRLKRRARYISPRALARKFEVDVRTIYELTRNLRKKHVEKESTY